MLRISEHLRGRLVATAAAGAMAFAVAGPGTGFAQEDSTKIDTETAASISGETSPADIFVLDQGDGQISANRYIGQSVMNTSEEIVGGINDLVLSRDGGIEAAVIGVGGFLGMGEKNVAVRFDAIEIVESTESEAIDLMINLSAEELQAAPAFKTKSMKLAEMRAEQAEREAVEPVGAAEPPAEPPAE